jgi:hypothetical protein
LEGLFYLLKFGRRGLAAQGSTGGITCVEPALQAPCKKIRMPYMRRFVTWRVMPDVAMVEVERVLTILVKHARA